MHGVIQPRVRAVTQNGHTGVEFYESLAGEEPPALQCPLPDLFRPSALVEGMAHGLGAAIATWACRTAAERLVGAEGECGMHGIVCRLANLAGYSRLADPIHDAPHRLRELRRGDILIE